MTHPPEGASRDSSFYAFTICSLQDFIMRDFVLPGYPEDFLEVADVERLKSFYMPSVRGPRLTPV